MLYFYLDNGSNVCGLEFNYKNGEEEDPLTNMGEGKRARVSWEEVRYSCDICKKLFTSDMNLPCTFKILMVYNTNFF